MLNVVSNSTVVIPSSAEASSPLSRLINNSTDANGQPVFAQVVRDALNKTTSSAVGRSDTSSKTTNSGPIGETFTASFVANARSSGTPAQTKRDSKTQAQSSSNAPATIEALLTQVLTIPPPPQLQHSQSLAAAAGEPTPGNTTVAPTTPADPSRQVQTATLDAKGALPLSSQIIAQLPGAPFGSLATLAGDAALLDGSANLANAKSYPLPATLGSSAAALAATATVASTVVAEVNGASEASALSAAAQTAVAAQVSTASPNSQQGPPLSSILQQVTALQGSTASRLAPPSVIVDLARTAVQSQLSQAAVKTALTSSLIPRALAGAAAPTSAESKGTQSALLQTRATDAVENGANQANRAATSNNQSASQDTSSNHSGQNTSDLLASSDPSSASITAAKNEPTSFSDAFSAASVPKPDAVQSAPTMSAAVPVLATQAPAPESTYSATADALPSAPAPPPPPPPPPLPALHIPDEPSGRFVSEAQLANAAGQSEMRIAMQTDKLGAIELHARVSGDEIGAAIIVEKRDAHAALAIELPALQQALSEKQLRVEQVALTQSSLSSTAGDAGANAQHNQRDTAQTSRSASFWNEARSMGTAAWFVPEQTVIFNAQGRLSVQA